PSGAVLVVGAGAAQRPAIAAIHPAARWLDIAAEADIGALADRLRSFGDLDHVLWLAPPSADGLDTLVGQQRAGLLHLFRLVKALLQLGYGDRALGLTVVTRGTQAVYAGDIPDPAHAGLHGFTGALAKECPRWSVRSLDLEEDSGWPVREMAALPDGGAEMGGEVLAHRGGQWFRRFLGPVAALPDGPPVYRQNGVYVVIGGAGGIGEAWTRHVIAEAGAQVVWIGRRQPDAAIRAKLDALAQPGPAPVYIAADAADRDSLQAAFAAIKRRWPAVHGVIHAAVGVFDRSIAEVDERHFREVLSVKIDAGVHVAQVFGGEPLDFILFFSSIVALETNGGLSGYAAGGAFADALALHLQGRRPYPVKVINWGHWDVGTGATIADATRTRLRRGGVVPIQPAEGMAALRRLLSTPLRQVVVLKTSRLAAHPLFDGGRTLHVAADGVPGLAQLPPALERFGDRVEALAPLSLFNNTALEAALLPLFAATLRALNLSDGDGGEGVPGFYRQWLRAGRALLAERGADRPAADPARAWEDWERAKRQALNHADLAAAIELVEACLRGLPDVLAGRVRATDIIFPDSSMRRVEGVYRDNAVADHFNGLLAAALAAAVEERLRHDAGARLRILEVGAGTGGTTALVLPRLAPYRENIEEYAYTDLSKAFLFHAEERFVGDYPFVRPCLFDVEKPLAGQGVAAGQYDMVIATNVLHATRNIHRTLATCKATLRKGGLLLLNEISTRSLFAHLTFGLLEGWWLSEDQPLRIPDSPGLYPERWRTVLEQEGFSPVLFPAPGTHALGQQVVVARGDGVVWQAAAPQAAKPAAPVPPPSVREVPAAPTPAGGEALKAAANRHLKALVARSLRMERDDIDEREPLEAYGIDSILVVQITNALREVFPDVPSTLLFECRTVDALSEHFIRNDPDRLTALTGVAPRASDAASAPQDRQAAPAPARSVGGARPPDARDAIAVIGMSCRFPQADTPDEYWEILKAGKSCIREVPAERWPLDGFFHPDPDEAVERGKSYAKWGGFLDNVTEFDPLFFNIAPKEAAAIDPQERLFLQSAWEALEDAGYTRERLTKEFRQQLGVFVGITRTGFDLFGPDLWRRGETVYPHTSFSSVANRLSYFLNARGPSVPVDTMCSSSLTAIHQACQNLRAGECELAIAGGVNVYLHPSGYVGLSAARMLSKDGLCRSFGKGGNGFVPGEGVAALLLKPLSRAIADGDRIHATIRATHVNHGGRTNGYTVPNPQAQAELVRDALRKAGVDARAVSCIEAHGTGTELGDPIEVAGLTQAFRHFTADNGFCALGSAKSNIGHLEAAAGISGVVKVILQMRHRQLAPSLHAAELNPNIDFSRTPFVVQRTLADWPRPRVARQGEVREFPRIAGVSSFGAGGANAHVVLEEYTDTRPATPVPPGGCVVVLSARSEERLKVYAGKLLAFLDRRMAAGDAPALADVAYTLQVGREAMEQRLGLVAGTLEELRDTLAGWLGGSADAAELYAGNVRDHKEVISAFAGDGAMQDTLAAWFREGKHGRLLKLWSKGLHVDWEGLYADAAGRPRRVSLPTYPFATTRYWLPVAAPVAESRTRAEAPAIEPAAKPAAVEPSAPAPAPLAKPCAIVLCDPASVPTAFAPPAAPPRITL
ncbi:MAG TPA: SDR family NAD(P)-dependent oxidoreductase, partial [Azospirillum sp.]